MQGLEKLAYEGTTGYTQSTIDGGFWTASLAVDAAGNLYFSNPFPTAGGGSTVGLFKETLNNGTYTQSTIGSSTLQPAGVALDGNDNVYTSNPGSGQLIKETLSGGTYTESTINFPGGANALVLDAKGDVFALNSNSNVSKLDLSDPPSLSFATTAYGSTSTDSPQTVTLSNNGNAILHFPVPGNGENPSIGSSFTLNSNAASACPIVSASSSASGTLAPEFGGPITGSLIFTDDALNQTNPNYATQTISLSGSGIQGPAPIQWPTPSAITYGTPLGSAQLNATSTVAGSFSYSPAAGTEPVADPQTLTATFTPSDTTDYITTTAIVARE